MRRMRWLRIRRLRRRCGTWRPGNFRRLRYWRLAGLGLRRGLRTLRFRTWQFRLGQLWRRWRIRRFGALNRLRWGLYVLERWLGFRRLLRSRRSLRYFGFSHRSAITKFKVDGAALASFSFGLGLDPGLIFVIVLLSYRAHFQSFHLMARGKSDAGRSLLGLAGAGVIIIRSLAIAIQFGKVTHVVQGEGVAWVQFVCLLDVAPRRLRVIAIQCGNAAKVEMCHLFVGVFALTHLAF